MERNVNFVYIGGLFLAIVAAMVAFIIWIGGVGFGEDKEYKHYVLYSTSAISGVGANTNIRYNGIAIGKVQSVDFKADNTDMIELKLKIKSDIRIAKDACLSTETQGLAGATSLSLVQGHSKEDLQEGSALCFKQGMMGQIFDNVQRSSEELSQILTGVNDFLNQENSRNIQELLVAVREITQNLEATRKNIDALSVSATKAIENFNLNLQRGDFNVRAIIAPSLLEFESTMNEIQRFFSKVNFLLDRLEKSPYDTIFGQRSQKEAKR